MRGAEQGGLPAQRMADRGIPYRAGMESEEEFGSRCLERPDQYEGDEGVTVEAWPSTIGPRARRSERIAILEEWLDFFSRPTPIRRLHLACRVNDRLLRALTPQTQLESLSLFWGPYSDLTPLRAMPRLRSLSLGGASALTDLAPLVHLRHLRHLELTNTRKLSDYSRLAEVTSLRMLSVDRGITGARSTAASLEFVRSLPELEEFWWDPRVDSGDYTPLLALAAAGKVSVTPHKGMSPTMVDLEWALPGMRAVNEERAARRIPIFSSDGDVTIMTTDVRGRTVFVPAETSDEIDAIDLSWASPITGPVSGLTLRTMSHTARTRTERFWLHLESPRPSEQLPPRVEGIVSSYDFSGDAAGPLLIWQSDAPVSTADEAQEFFVGNTAVRVCTPPVRLDATGVEPLRDEEFWEIVDALGGKANLMASFKAVRALIPRGEEFMLRWAHSFSAHALQLMPVVDGLQRSGVVPADLTWHALGAVIAAGRDAYDAVLSNPDAFDVRLLRNAQIHVLFIAETAVQRNRPAVDKVVTRLSLLWDSERAAQETELISTAGTPLEISLHCARGIMRVGGGYVERLVLVDLGVEPDENAAGSAADALESFGGDLVAGPEIAEAAVSDLAHSDAVFTIHRRSSLPVDDYLSRYAPGPPRGA